MNKDMSYVRMSSADWQRNEQRHESTVRRLIIAIIVLAVSLVINNAAWLIYESQFETVYETEEEYGTDIAQETVNGNNNYIGNEGSVINGEADN